MNLDLINFVLIQFMDYLFIFRHQCLQEANEGRQLDTLEGELVKNDGVPTMEGVRYSYSNLAAGDNFKLSIFEITGVINKLALEFINVQLVSEDTELFTSVLPQEFNVRKLSMPFVFTNFVEWRGLVKEKYGLGNQSLREVARNLALGEGGDVELLKGLLFKLRQERVLEDSDVVFFKGHQNKGLGGDFAYFRCIGLPFQISKGEIIQKLVEPERFSIKSYGLSLIFQHGKFSGKAVIKIPAQFAEMLQNKDRMFIGRRYVEIVPIHQEEYDSYKFREERQREETRNFREEPRPYREPFQSHKPKRHGSGSSSPSPSYSRSRSNERPVEIHSLLSEAAMKVRGLPYSLNNWDIEEIFKRFNFVRGSVKLGFLGERKTGEAVILFPNREEAERAMALHGVTVQGRYLELRIINKENYDRFR